jgi:hypothetical protein
MNGCKGKHLISTIMNSLNLCQNRINALMSWGIVLKNDTSVKQIICIKAAMDMLLNFYDWGNPTYWTTLKNIKNKYLKFNFKHENECNIWHKDITLTLTQQPQSVLCNGHLHGIFQWQDYLDKYIRSASDFIWKTHKKKVQKHFNKFILNLLKNTY